MTITQVRATLTLHKLMTINMKGLLFGTLVCFITIGYSQNMEMKERTFLRFKYLELSEKEKERILLEASSHTIEERNGDYVYRLPNGNVIFEIKDITNYLFESDVVFEEYFQASGKPQKIDTLLHGQSHPIKDTAFIEKLEMYITFFTGEHGMEIDLKDSTSLEKIDQLLNRMGSQELRKFRLSIIALVGEFIVANVAGSEWKYLNIPSSRKERVPVILVNEKTLINPASVFYEEFNKKESNERYQINLKDAVKAFLKS